MSDKLSFRKAVIEDCRRCYKWRNDKTARKNSFDSKPLVYANHKNWFLEHLKRKGCHLYILTLGSTPIGQVRFDINGRVAEISDVFKRYLGIRVRKLQKPILTLASGILDGLKVPWILEGNDNSKKLQFEAP